MWNSRKTSNQRVGELGEKTACQFLMKQGFTIRERNYWQKWGEIDIVAQKGNMLHFVEVKTVSRENVRDVPRETLEGYRPEENVHPQKLERLSRTIQTYLLEKEYEGEWQFDVLTVLLDVERRKAKCRYIENVIL